MYRVSHKNIRFYIFLILNISSIKEKLLEELFTLVRYFLTWAFSIVECNIFIYCIKYTYVYVIAIIMFCKYDVIYKIFLTNKYPNYSIDLSNVNL